MRYCAIRQGTIIFGLTYLFLGAFEAVFAQGLLKPAPSPAEKEEMRSLYHELDMRRLEASRQYGVYLDMRRALRYCVEKTAFIDDCRAETNLKREELESRIREIQLKRLEGLAKDAPSEKKEGSSNTNIITQQSQSITVINRPRHPISPERTPTVGYVPRIQEKPKFTPRPDFAPQNRFQGGDGF